MATVIASRPPTAARRGRSDGATTEQSTTAPARSRPPSSAMPGRSSSAWGPSVVTTVSRPVAGSVTNLSGTSAAGRARQRTVAPPGADLDPAGEHALPRDDLDAGAVGRTAAAVDLDQQLADGERTHHARVGQAELRDEAAHEHDTDRQVGHRHQEGGRQAAEPA